MKKLLMVTVLALGALVASTESASAWCKFKAGIGANISYEGGGNNFLWGAYQCGQNPNCCAPQCGMPGMGGGFPATYGDFGASAYPVSQPAPATTGAPVQPVDYGYGQGYNQGYQPVNYYYPAANYGYYQAPSYWYGR